jgi:hypothetical protein
LKYCNWYLKKKEKQKTEIQLVLEEEREEREAKTEIQLILEEERERRKRSKRGS